MHDLWMVFSMNARIDAVCLFDPNVAPNKTCPRMTARNENEVIDITKDEYLKTCAKCECLKVRIIPSDDVED